MNTQKKIVVGMRGAPVKVDLCFGNKKKNNFRFTGNKHFVQTFIDKLISRNMNFSFIYEKL